MSELFKILSELLRDKNTYNISIKNIIVFSILIIIFFLITILTLINPLKWENIELLKSIWETSFYIFIFFILILGLSFWAFKKENKNIWDIIEMLEKIQKKFLTNKYLTACIIKNDTKSWKNLFQIKNDLYIVCSIDDIDIKIDNFYIRSSNNEYIRKIKELSKDEEISKDEKINLWYKNTHIVFKKTIELSKNFKYEESIKFLLDKIKTAWII